MTPINALDPVLRELGPDDHSAGSSGGILLYLDPGSGRVLDRKPGGFWSVFGRRPRRFLVHTEDTGAIAMRRDMVVTVLATEGSMEVRLSYRLQCPVGAASTAVEALAEGSSLQVRLEQMITSWTRTFLLRDEQAMLTEPLALVSGLEAHLAERTAAATGLALTVRAHTGLPPWLQPRQLGPFHLEIQTAESEESVDVRLDALLVVDPPLRRRAFDSAERLEELVREAPSALTAHAARYFSLHQLSFELESTAAPAFRRLLDQLFAPVGRKVERLSLGGGTGPALECDVSASVPLVLTDPTLEVEVEARAHLEVQDLGTYSRAGRPDLTAWFEEVVETQVRREAFGRSLADLHRDAEACRRSIVEALTAAARKLGFHARLLVDFRGLELDVPKTVVCHHSVTLRPRQDSTDLEVHAHGALRLEDAGRFVEAGLPELQGWFEEHLAEAVGPLANRSRPELLLHKDDVLNRVAGELSTGAAAVGYRLEVHLDLGGTGDELGFRSLRHHLTLQVADAPEPLELRARFLLELADPATFTDSGVTDLVTWTRRQLTTAATRTLFGRGYRELSVRDAELRARVAQTIEEEAGTIGYHLSVSMEIVGIDSSLRGPHYCSFEFACQVEGHSEPVQLHVEMILQVEDTGRFLAADAPDLDMWANAEVPRIAKDHLFKVRFTDLCIDLDRHKATVEEQVEEAASAIGLRVKQLTTFTDLPTEALSRGERLAVNGDFATNLAGVAVGLELRAEVRTVDPELLRECLDKHPALVEHMENTLRRRLERELRTIDPGVFYTEFQASVDESEQPVAQRIEDVARAVLASEFHLEVLDVHCQQKRTDIADLYQSLIATNHEVDLRTDALGGNLPLKFVTELRVEGVAGKTGWLHFYQKSPDPETLVATARSHLLSFLADQDSRELRIGSQETMRLAAEDSLRAFLEADLGLVVALATWRRRATDVEGYLADVKEQSLAQRDPAPGKHPPSGTASAHARAHRPVARAPDAGGGRCRAGTGGQDRGLGSGGARRCRCRAPPLPSRAPPTAAQGHRPRRRRKRSHPKSRRIRELPILLATAARRHSQFAPRGVCCWMSRSGATTSTSSPWSPRPSSRVPCCCRRPRWSCPSTSSRRRRTASPPPSSVG